MFRSNADPGVLNIEDDAAVLLGNSKLDRPSGRCIANSVVQQNRQQPLETIHVCPDKDRFLRRSQR